MKITVVLANDHRTVFGCLISTYVTFNFTIINPLAILLMKIKNLITLNFHASKWIKCILTIIGIAFPYSNASNMPLNVP